MKDIFFYCYSMGVMSALFLFGLIDLVFTHDAMVCLSNKWCTFLNDLCWQDT